MESGITFGEGQRKATERFGRAAKILYERTGKFAETILADPGMGIRWIRENHQDIAPGFDGLPFTVDVAVEEVFTVNVPKEMVEAIEHPLKRRVKVKRIARMKVKDVDPRYDTFTVTRIRSNHCISDETDTYIVEVVAKKEL